MRRFFDEQRRIVSGLATLSNNKLPPELINMKSLTSTLIGLRNKVEQQNLKLGMNKFHDIFSQQTSYAVFKNGTIWLVPEFQ